MTEFLPIIGIGSVPFESVDEAMDFSLEHHIAFLPQLTARGEEMTEQARTGHHLCMKDFSQTPGPKKFQLCGPHSSKVPHKSVLKTAKSIIESLKEDDLLLFIDEPILPFLTDEDREFYSELSKLTDIGIHCCGNTSWHSLSTLPIKYISFDAELSLSKVPVDEFIEKGIKIVLGVIPTNKEYDITQLFEEYKEFVFKYQNQILLSTACGLANKTEDEAWEVLEDLEVLRHQFFDYISSNSGS